MIRITHSKIKIIAMPAHPSHFHCKRSKKFVEGQNKTKKKVNQKKEEKTEIFQSLAKVRKTSDQKRRGMWGILCLNTTETYANILFIIITIIVIILCECVFHCCVSVCLWSYHYYYRYTVFSFHFPEVVAVLLLLLYVCSLHNEICQKD